MLLVLHRTQRCGRADLRGQENYHRIKEQFGNKLRDNLEIHMNVLWHSLWNIQINREVMIYITKNIKHKGAKSMGGGRKYKD